MYQPIVIETTNELIEMLISISFFKENDLNNTKFAENYFLNKLTEKFIDGKIYDEDLFTDEEFETCLKEIIVGTVLLNLKDKGYVNSYEDENTEEMFFLTEDGKEYLKNIQNNKLF